MIRDDVPENMAAAENGLYSAIPDSIYHSRTPGIASKSVLEIVARAPAVYAEWLKGGEKKQAEPLAFGKAFHCALLEPSVYAETYVVEPKFGDCRKPENKRLRDDWRGENEGRIIIEQADAVAISGMVKAALAHPKARLLVEGVSELTMRWTDPETGIICKARADRYVDTLGICLDVKSCEDARPDAFTRNVTNYGYHRQNAFYEDGFRELGAPLEHFVFMAIEKTPPYLIGIYNLDDDAIKRGRGWVRRHLHTFAECIERGEYPGLPTTVQTLSLPGWAKDAA